MDKFINKPCNRLRILVYLAALISIFTILPDIKMSKPLSGQADGQGLFERLFQLKQHGTTVRTEFVAGFTTFLTMV